MWQASFLFQTFSPFSSSWYIVDLNRTVLSVWSSRRLTAVWTPKWQIRSRPVCGPRNDRSDHPMRCIILSFVDGCRSDLILFLTGIFPFPDVQRWLSVDPETTDPISSCVVRLLTALGTPKWQIRSPCALYNVDLPKTEQIRSYSVWHPLCPHYGCGPEKNSDLSVFVFGQSCWNERSHLLAFLDRSELNMCYTLSKKQIFVGFYKRYHNRVTHCRKNTS
jgi:hypothetical protein